NEVCPPGRCEPYCCDPRKCKCLSIDFYGLVCNCDS
uniref:Augerpeptide hheTx5 n=1 Tax=Hastula hectica TaxID=745793 RepID=TEF5_HASHE|nr:RecName: Full=Augerpeptide hheTx5 [Hastula hectica]